MMKPETKRLIEEVFIKVLSGVTFTIIVAIPTTWAWNYVMPRLFGLPTTDILGMVCLSWICTVFFSLHRPKS